jgi:acyl carrier protein
MSSEHNHSNGDILHKVCDVIATQLGINAATITPNASLIDDLGADSLDSYELIMALEETFKCNFDDSAFKVQMTVQDIVSYIQQHLTTA